MKEPRKSSTIRRTFKPMPTSPLCIEMTLCQQSCNTSHSQRPHLAAGAVGPCVIAIEHVFHLASRGLNMTTVFSTASEVMRRAAATPADRAGHGGISATR